MYTNTLFNLIVIFVVLIFTTGLLAATAYYQELPERIGQYRSVASNPTHLISGYDWSIGGGSLISDSIDEMSLGNIFPAGS